MSAKALIVLFLAAAAGILWTVRKERARKVLAEIDAGKRCVACSSTQMHEVPTGSRCLLCGHVSSLKMLQSASVSEREIAEITRPKRD